MSGEDQKFSLQGFDEYRVHDSNVHDLQGQPMTMVALFGILCMICDGKDVLIRNGARESAPEIMARLRNYHVADHEAMVRSARERQGV